MNKLIGILIPVDDKLPSLFKNITIGTQLRPECQKQTTYSNNSK